MRTIVVIPIVAAAACTCTSSPTATQTIASKATVTIPSGCDKAHASIVALSAVFRLVRLGLSALLPYPIDIGQ